MKGLYEPQRPRLEGLKLTIPLSYLNEERPNLPLSIEVHHAPRMSWKDLDGKEFSYQTDRVYEEITKWRKNLFKLPSGRAGKDFVIELTSWLEHFNKGTVFEGIARKVYMILPSLLLQKPSRNSKAKDHQLKFTERLKTMERGEDK